MDKLDNKQLGRGYVIKKMNEKTKLMEEKTSLNLQQQRDKIKTYLVKNKLNPDI